MGAKDPKKCFIDWTVKQKLDTYVACCKDEISGLGKVEVIPEGIAITDVYLLEQEVSSAETTLDNDSVAQFITDLVGRGEDPSKIKLWWHSHVNMGVYWSGTDEDTAKRFGNGWMVSLVVNKRKDTKCRIDVYEPFHMTLDDVQLVMTVPQLNDSTYELYKQEVEEKVHPKVYAASSGAGWGHQGAYWGSDAGRREKAGTSGGKICYWRNGVRYEETVEEYYGKDDKEDEINDPRSISAATAFDGEGWFDAFGVFHPYEELDNDPRTQRWDYKWRCWVSAADKKRKQIKAAADPKDKETKEKKGVN